MKYVLLPTDLLLYLLVISIIVFIFWSLRYEHFRAPWRYILTNKMGMIALIILLTYTFIGLLDSIHFRLALQPTQKSQTIYYSAEVKSLLDLMIAPLGQQDEQSYSAPFASNLYSKETVILPNGMVMQAYPKLEYAAKNLTNQNAKIQDILKRILLALLFTSLFLIILTTIIFFTLKFISKKYFFKFKIAWRESLLTFSIILVIIVICAVLATNYHILGTDKVGQDVFYEAIKSIRTGLIIGTLTTLIMLPFAVLFGMMAGYFGGWIDDIIQYIYTTLSSIPGVLLITAAILSLQVFIENHPNLFTTLAMRADIRLLALCVILGITSWTNLCRLLRAETLKIRELDYVSAAITLGSRDPKILLQHILPNVMHIILITVVLDFSGLVLAEAVLSYVGVGVDPTTFSWGNMINSARLELAREPIVWWPLFSAFIFMFIFVLAANLFADTVRDAFDPRIRNMEKNVL